MNRLPLIGSFVLLLLAACASTIDPSEPHGPDATGTISQGIAADAAPSWRQTLCTPERIASELASLKQYANVAGQNLSQRPPEQGGVLICSGGADGSYANNILHEAATIYASALDPLANLLEDASASAGVRQANCGSVAPAMLNELHRLAKPCCVELYIIASANDHNAVAAVPLSAAGTTEGQSTALIIDGWWCQGNVTVVEPGASYTGVQASVQGHFASGSNLQSYPERNAYYSGLTPEACSAAPQPPPVAIPIPAPAPVTDGGAASADHCSCQVTCSGNFWSTWLDVYGIGPADCQQTNPVIQSATAQYCDAGVGGVGTRGLCQWTGTVVAPAAPPPVPTGHCSCRTRCNYDLNSHWTDVYGIGQSECAEGNAIVTQAEDASCGSWSVATRQGCTWVP